jgi:type VI secretion system secreted protein Hcp
MSQTGTFHLGGGGGAGKVNVQDLSITKYVDKSTPNLLKLCATGEHVPEAQLVVRKAGGKDAVEFLKVKLTKVMVTNVSTGGSKGDERVTENVTLNFIQFKYEYTPQKADGTADAPIPLTYNIAENVAS